MLARMRMCYKELICWHIFKVNKNSASGIFIHEGNQTTGTHIYTEKCYSI